ncbi:MAG: type 1 periplasmic-binding domain-containing protein [Solirubrobacteraceae bacterium]
MSLSRRFRPAFPALAIVAALAIAGCGSSSKPESASSSSGASTSASESSTTSASSSVMAKAEAEFNKYKTPVGLEGLTKIGKPIPTGKSIDFVICAPAACRPPATDFTAAAKILGWHVKVIDAGETAGSQQAAMQQTITEKPSSVVIEGLATELFTKQIEELEKDKITTVLWQIAGAAEHPPALYTIPGPSHYREITKALAAASVVAGGEKAEIGFMTVPAFPIYAKTIDPEFKEAVAALCPSCKVLEYQLPVSSLGKNATSLIVNFTRGHPGIDVLVNDQDVTSLGLEGALKGAGVTNVKDIGLYPTEANYPDLAAETEFALVPDPYHEMAFLVADSLARVYTGQSPEPDIKTTAPAAIWTKETLPKYNKGEEPPVVANYETTFKALWGK